MGNIPRIGRISLKITANLEVCKYCLNHFNNTYAKFQSVWVASLSVIKNLLLEKYTKIRDKICKIQVPKITTLFYRHTIEK